MERSQKQPKVLLFFLYSDHCGQILCLVIWFICASQKLNIGPQGMCVNLTQEGQ